MKKIALALLMVVTLVFSLAACGDKGNVKTGNTDVSTNVKVKTGDVQTNVKVTTDTGRISVFIAR